MPRGRLREERPAAGREKVSDIKKSAFGTYTCKYVMPGSYICVCARLAVVQCADILSRRHMSQEAGSNLAPSFRVGKSVAHLNTVVYGYFVARTEVMSCITCTKARLTYCGRALYAMTGMYHMGCGAILESSRNISRPMPKAIPWHIPRILGILVYSIWHVNTSNYCVGCRDENVNLVYRFEHGLPSLSPMASRIFHGDTERNVMRRR